MKPFFSIVIPVLNEEKYLPKLLNCLLTQTYKDFEVIIVDGNSIDKTCLEAEKYRADYLSFTLVHSKKQGPGIQRNIGARQASGEYLVFFDADVQIHKDFLEAVHLHLIRHRTPFLTTWIEADRKSSTDRAVVMMLNAFMELLNASGRPPVVGFNIIIKRNVFKRLNGFNEKIFIMEDGELGVRAKRKGLSLTILRDPRLVMSFRRLRSEGSFEIIKKLTKVNLHFFLYGPITKQIIEYSMGGHAHRRRQQFKINLKEVNTYINRIKGLEKKLNNILFN